jgi:hypothetical protein
VQGEIKYLNQILMAQNTVANLPREACQIHGQAGQ